MIYTDNVISRINKYEKRFKKNKYNGSGKAVYKIKQGKVPIMLSAPHAINHYRNGEIKCADLYTGGIAYYLHKKCGCHLIYLSSYSEVDPNFDNAENCEYKCALGKYINENGIKFLIDLHGSKAEHGFAIEMGTIDDNNSSLKGYNFLINLFKMIFDVELGEYLIIDKKTIQKNIVFSVSNPNTVTNYISQVVGIPSIQIEINKLYRDINNEERLTRLISALERILGIMSDIVKREYFDRLEVSV